MSSILKAKQNGAATIHELEVVDYGRLRSRDAAEMEKLLSNARAPGAFYLDLQDQGRGSSILQEKDSVYQLAERYFDQLPAWKVQDAREDQKPSQDRGYKQCDGDESYEISRDERLSGQVVLPAAFREKEAMLDTFSEGCHEACLTMLSCLSESLGNGQGFQEHHRSGQASDSGLKLIYEPWRHRAADVVDNTHTDSGTLTFLFYEELGVEAEMKGGGSDDAWAFIPAKEGCAIINVADSLERMSGGALHSLLHRVTQPADGFKKRYYISYFLRPEQA
ncbi:2og-fe oxygenase family [Diplodia corticola]|uniref:2og-fe oxygenase family n=1 Tax=Diplodia corticola TaxID=236234 RepID=A0A1J9RS72_9PEZI|nr:2og-fe oxygenase family [Diplodia corticola]OJD30373.1 2og-fe oxygenase family [Diplodia corticola]